MLRSATSTSSFPFAVQSSRAALPASVVAKRSLPFPPAGHQKPSSLQRNPVDSDPEAIVTLVRATDFKSGGGCGDTASAGSIPVRFRHFGFAASPYPLLRSALGPALIFRFLRDPASIFRVFARPRGRNAQPLKHAVFGPKLLTICGIAPHGRAAKSLPQALRRAEKEFRALCYNEPEGRSGPLVRIGNDPETNGRSFDQ